MLSSCSHGGGSPVIWKFRWVVVVPIDNILVLPMILLDIKLALETFISIIFVIRSWSICWMKEVTSSNSYAFDASCRREFEKACFYLLWNRPKSFMHVRSILWSVRLIIFIPYEFSSTLSHWLICSRKRSCCANPRSCTRLRYPRWWFPIRTR